jgi:hypothetical protein
MSDGFVRNSTVMDWTLKIGATLMSILMMTTSFFLTKAWDSIAEIKESIVDLKLIQNKIESSQFTSKEWISAKSVLDNERLGLDRRIIRVEETYPIILESIVDIKETIKKIETEIKK